MRAEDALGASGRGAIPSYCSTVAGFGDGGLAVPRPGQPRAVLMGALLAVAAVLGCLAVAPTQRAAAYAPLPVLRPVTPAASLAPGRPLFAVQPTAHVDAVQGDAPLPPSADPAAASPMQSTTGVADSRAVAPPEAGGPAPRSLRQALIAAAALGPLLFGGAPAARAAEFLADTGLGAALIDVLQAGIKQVEAAGDTGPVFLWFFLSCAEMVPLLPTQPLYLAAGLLFGTPEGILPAWGGTLTAAVLAFWVSRRLGSPDGPLYGLVKFAMQKETQDDPVGSAELESSLEKVVADMSLVSSTLKIVLLRLSPVIPFSVSNYLCGLTSVAFLPFLLGTAIGTMPWALLYVSLGATGHELLQTGGDFRVLLEIVVERAAALLADPRAQAAALALTLLLAAVLLKPFFPSPGSNLPGQEPEEPKSKSAEDTPL
eukprot:EG_transcript_7179